jgi:hypothetical protein
LSGGEGREGKGRMKVRPADLGIVMLRIKVIPGSSVP